LAFRPGFTTPLFFLDRWHLSLSSVPEEISPENEGHLPERLPWDVDLDLLKHWEIFLKGECVQ
jgi:hypothetical protein